MDEKPSHSYALYLGVLCALLIAGFLFYIRKPETSTDFLSGFTVPKLATTTISTERTERIQISPKITITQGVERWYTHTRPKFSFRLPDGYSAPEFETGDPGVGGVLVYNDRGDKLMILVHTIPQNASLDGVEIEKKLRNVITSAREGALGTVVRGVAFTTNSPEWGGDGVGLWASYNGHLYELITTRSNQELLDYITANWYFAPPIVPPPPKP